jgi:signal peptidase I
MGIVETLVATLVVFLLLQTFVGRTYAVEQTSMETTLEPGQRVIVDLLTPRFDPYKRGDIVVFTPPAEVQLGEPLIKRVIAAAGDTVEIRDGRVVVDGLALIEPYVFDDQPTLAQGDQSRWVVPPGYLFVLGDHRAVSRDSRAFGPIPISSVVGRAWLRFYPLDDLRILSTGG